MHAEFAQWTADNDRLVIAALSNREPGNPFSYDELAMAAVQARCEEKLGESAGLRYFRTLIATLPSRRPDLFPELQDLPK